MNEDKALPYTSNDFVDEVVSSPKMWIRLTPTQMVEFFHSMMKFREETKNLLTSF